MRHRSGCIWMLLLSAAIAHAAVVIEGFDDVASSGWTTSNQSHPQGTPVETTSWYQGNPAVFPAQAGDPDSYAAASFTSAAFGGDISTWLISPRLVFRAGSTVSFYTRTTSNPAIAPDRLEVRFSSGGKGVGGDVTTVGNFNTLLLTINETLSLTGYPDDWTQYSLDLPVAGMQLPGRIAFRYTVPDTSLNGDYIGIDTVQYDAVPEPSTWLTGLFTIPILAIARRLAVGQKRRTN